MVFLQALGVVVLYRVFCAIPVVAFLFAELKWLSVR
jgi:hypothetical protein